MRRAFATAFGHVPVGDRWRDLLGRFVGARNVLKRIQGPVLFRKLGDGGGKSALDLGCGGGFFTLELARHGYKAVGADIFPMPPDAPDAQSWKFVTILAGAPLPFADDTFDLVLLSDVIIVLPDPVASLREAVRSLKPGGRLVIVNTLGRLQIERAYEKNDFRIKMLKWIFPRTPRDYSAFCENFLTTDRVGRPVWYTAEEISALMRSAGLKVDEVEYPFPGLPLTLVYWRQFLGMCSRGVLSIPFSIPSYIILRLIDKVSRSRDPSSVFISGFKP